MSDSRLYESVIQPLTTENLQILQEQYKNIKKTSTTARIVKWLSEIPQNLGSADNVSTANGGKEGNEYQGQDENDTRAMDGQQPPQPTRKLSKENSQSLAEYNNNSAGKKNNNDYDRMKKMMNNNTPVAANNASEKRSSRDKGRLCCYLKVEVGGNTQLLPIHENDIPQNLAYNFCKSNNILNSVNSLKEHIINAIENYTTKCKSQETLKDGEKKKKSKTKLNQNENSIKSNKLTKSKESLQKSKNKLKSKSSSSINVRNKGSEKGQKMKSALKSNDNLKNKSTTNSNENLKSKSYTKSNENIKTKSNIKNNEILKKKVNTKYLKNSIHS